LLSRTQLVELTKAVFLEVAENPEHLIGDDLDDAQATVLAQIVGSVARSLGEDPEFVLTGDGFVRIVRGAIHVAVLNADKLLDLDDASPATNLLFKVLREVVAVLEDEAVDVRNLVTRDVFVEIVERVLPLVSANLEPLLDGAEGLVGDTVREALDLASDALQNRTNGANLPILIEGLLRKVLWGELNLDDESAVLNTATTVLRAAA
jgi:hypothetical protein